MKKLTVLFAVVALVLFFSGELKAKGKCFDEKGVDLYVNAGVLTDGDFSFSPFWWYVGPNLDIQLGNRFMVSPEVNLMFHEFDFDGFLLNPAVCLNAKFKCFFVGAGLSKYWVVSGTWVGEITELLLRVNVGFKTGNFRFRAFLDTAFDHLFEKWWTLYGFQVGFGF